MKLKAMLGLALLLVSSASALANPTRISNELATVKACHEISQWQTHNFSLAKVTKASVNDSGQRLTVELTWNEGTSECTGWQWFNFDGTKTGCEGCDTQPDGTVCVCASAMCTHASGGSETTTVQFNK